MILQGIVSYWVVLHGIVSIIGQANILPFSRHFFVIVSFSIQHWQPLPLQALTFCSLSTHGTGREEKWLLEYVLCSDERNKNAFILLWETGAAEWQFLGWLVAKPKRERNISAATKNVFKIGNILVSVRPMFHGGEWRATHCQYLEKLPTPTVTLSIQGLDSQDSKDRYYLQMEIGWNTGFALEFIELNPKLGRFPGRWEIKYLVAFSFVECFSLPKLEE